MGTSASELLRGGSVSSRRSSNGPVALSYGVTEKRPAYTAQTIRFAHSSNLDPKKSSEGLGWRMRIPAELTTDKFSADIILAVPKFKKGLGPSLYIVLFASY